MAEMQAMVLREFGGQFVPETRPVPEPGIGEVRVKVVGVGAGLTLEHARLGRMGGETPRIMGHEFSGLIDAVGPGVLGWAPGQAVTATFYLLCGSCEWCASGRETLCTAMRGFIGTAIDGAFAEYLVVPAHNLVAIPDGVEIAHAGVVADAIATPYHAIRERVRLVAGQRVGVIGAGGGLGVHVLQMVRVFGGVAVAVEIDDVKAAEIERRGLADAVVQATGDAGSVDAVVDTVGSTATLTEGVRALGRAGTFVALGFDPTAALGVEPFRLITEEIVVTGTRYATRAEIAQTLELVRQGRVEPVIGATFAHSQLNEAFAAIARNEVFGRIVIEM
jgi:D-arabinose 1-dehydrogenase-like Zn-dependent alcohol dehydrogenase